MLQVSIDWFTYQLLGLSPVSRMGQSINFFFYDSIKLLILLFSMIAVIGVIRSYIPQNKIRQWIENKPRFVGHLAASLFGAVTPFCSCSSIPIFLSFMEAGIPLGIAFSFLITSPLLNEYLFVLMVGFFGIKIAILYALSGILVGVSAGMILGRMGLEKYLCADLIAPVLAAEEEKGFPSFGSRVRYGIHEGAGITKKIAGWVILGVAVGAYIHNYIPQEMIQSIIGKGGIFTVPLAVLIGVPMYGSCAAIVPIAVVLFQKGVPLGTALAFMMAVAALSLPEAIILRRAMQTKLILIFFGIVALGIMGIGFLFNVLAAVLIA